MQPPEDKPHRRRGRGGMRGEDDFRGIKGIAGDRGGRSQDRRRREAALKRRATTERLTRGRDAEAGDCPERPPENKSTDTLKGDRGRS